MYTYVYNAWYIYILYYDRIYTYTAYTQIHTYIYMYVYVYVAVNTIQSDHHHSLDVDQARLLERGKTSGRADDNLVLSSAVALLSSYEGC